MQDCTFSVLIFGKKVDVSQCESLQSLPPALNPTEVSNLLNILDKLHICAGHPDPHLIEMIKSKKGKINSKNGETAAYLDNNPIKLNGTGYPQTIRSAKCQLFGYSKV